MIYNTVEKHLDENYGEFPQRELELVAHHFGNIIKCSSYTKVENCEHLQCFLPEPNDDTSDLGISSWELDHLCNDVWCVEKDTSYHETTFSRPYVDMGFEMVLGAFQIALEKVMKEKFPNRDTIVFTGITRNNTMGRYHFISISVSHS